MRRGRTSTYQVAFEAASGAAVHCARKKTAGMRPAVR